MNAPAERPLDGIKVVDFTRLFAGPLCTMVLSDMGAEVIKVESPGGDDARHFGPPFLGGEGMNFMALNRGKKSVVIDLKSEEGKRATRALLAEADVVVENFRPGVADRLGIGYSDLKSDSVVYCSISGFSGDGDMGGRPALDLIVQALSGVMVRQADSAGVPQLLCITIADTYAAAQAVQGILASLLVRERTGRGQRVEVSLLEAILTAQAYRIVADAETLDLPALQDAVPYQAFETKDGKWLALAIVSPANWHAFATAIGRAELADDPRFATNPDRVESMDVLIPLVEDEVRGRELADWLELLDAAGVPCAPVLDLTDLMADPAMLEAGVLAELDHPKVGRIRTIGTGVRLSRTPAKLTLPAPSLGEHTHEVLERLDLSPEDLASCLGVAR